MLAQDEERRVTLADWHFLRGFRLVAGGPVILGVVVGSKFLIFGTVRVIQGVAGLPEAR